MAALVDAQRLIWVTETVDNEAAVWRMHCAKKPAADYSDVHTAMEEFYEGIAMETGQILGKSELAFTRILEWNETLKQYFQVSSNDSVGFSTNANCLPVQCAAVVTLNAQVPFGARRQSYTNRAYLGPVLSAGAGPEGKLTTTVKDKVLADLEILHDDLEAITNESGVTFTNGLAITSEKLEIASALTHASIGDVVDTQRRRRRSLVEARTGSFSF